jgi:hypothetical protein
VRAHHHHIDLGTVLRGTVCALYSNLVTRPTGAAVRSEIERAIADATGPTVTVIDFSQVTLLDFSCADEIVAKLMLRYVRPAALVPDAGASPVTAGDGYFVFRGSATTTWTRSRRCSSGHGLAIVAVVDGELRLVGELGDDERRAWELLHAVAPADARRLAAASGHDEATAEAAARRAGAPAAGDARPGGRVAARDAAAVGRDGGGRAAGGHRVTPR